MSEADDCPADVKRSIFAVCYGDALEAIGHGWLPDWIADPDDAGHFERICREFGLPQESRDELIAVVCALDECLKTPTPDEFPATKKEKLKTLEQLARVKAGLAEIGVSGVPSLVVDLSDEQATPLGDVTFDAAPGVLARLRKAVDEALAAIDEVGTGAGRRPDYMYWATMALGSIVDRHQPDMSNGRRAALAEELFADVRHRRGHRSRAADHDIDEVPRLRDMVRRVGRRRTRGG